MLIPAVDPEKLLQSLDLCLEAPIRFHQALRAINWSKIPQPVRRGGLADLSQRQQVVLCLVSLDPARCLLSRGEGAESKIAWPFSQMLLDPLVITISPSSVLPNSRVWWCCKDSFVFLTTKKKFANI